MLRNYKHILPSGIPFDLVVLSDDNNKLVQNYKCKICDNLVVDARDCSICQELYCNDCSGKEKEECKTCRNGKTLKPLSKREREILKEFQIRCIFKDKGCKDVIGYGEYIEHIYSCPSNQVKVEDEGYKQEEEFKEGSEDKGTEKFDFHVNNNNSTYKMTDIYNPSNFTKDKASGWKCSFCSEKLKESGKISHILSCEKFEIKCKDCSKPIKRIKYPFHNHGRCFMKMLNFYEKFRKQGEKLEEVKKLLKSYESKGDFLFNNSISDINMSCEGQKTKKNKKTNGNKKKGKKDSDLSENDDEEEKISLKSDKEEDDDEEQEEHDEEEENESFLRNKRGSSKSRELDMKEEFKNIRNDISLLKDISKDKRRKNKNKKYLNDYIH